MPRKIPRLLWVVLPLAYLVYFYDLSATGLLGPDEPRYASVSREMARSGDWITPRLWGAPWFEKPALLYWLSGMGFRLGLSTELAPRLPGVLMAVAFLAFYWWTLRREFGCRAAWLASLILGSSGMWVAYSQNGVTDLPLAATFSAAMLLALPWVARRETGQLPVAAAMFGLAVLAKGLVPLVLAAPLLMGRHVLDWLRWRVVLPFILVALPWYAMCYWRNGWPFIHEFFVVHHFSRVTSDALMHARPAWFYLPILGAGLLPWTPLLGLIARRVVYRDRRRVFLAVWMLVVLALFSISTNKLPGYILPLLPAAAALMALALDEVADARVWLAACAVLLVAFPITAQVLPAAVLNGLSRAPRPVFQAVWLAAVAVALLAWLLEARGKRVAAVLAVAAGAALGTGYLKSVATPQLDRGVSARGLWREIGPRAGEVCIGNVKRDWEYGLSYYSGMPLPDCEQQPKALQVLPAAGGRAYLGSAP
ncbi:MAG: glycosyltransferase family 39 protein [Candidatus Solibacter sp.]|nr:glycosyltransferase family 39 protein [Candidatus Solibacter sp.]